MKFSVCAPNQNKCIYLLIYLLKINIFFYSLAINLVYLSCTHINFKIWVTTFIP